MAAFPSFLHRRVETILAFDKKDLGAVMNKLAEQKKTGTLTIHLHQGAVNAIEWKERQET